MWEKKYYFGFVIFVINHSHVNYDFYGIMAVIIDNFDYIDVIFCSTFPSTKNR
jgi:hypothetical protein